MDEPEGQDGQMTSKATGRWEPWMGVAIALRADGMKQAELAAKTSLSESDVSRIVNGKRKLYVHELIEIAKVQGRGWGWYLEGPTGSDDDGGGDHAKGVYISSFSRPLVAA